MALVLVTDANPGVASWSTSLSEVAPVAVVTDPGSAAAIPVTASASISFTIAAATAETNTVAAPTLAGQELLLAVGSLGAGGTRAVTFSAPFNQVPNSVVTFSAAGQCAMFKAFRIGANLVWKLVFVQGAVPS